MRRLLIGFIFAALVFPQDGVIVVKRRAAAAPGGYSDSFSGSASTALATHDANWTTASASYPVTNVALSGSSTAQVTTSYAQAGGYYNASSAGISQLVLKAYSDSGTKKRPCVYQQAAHVGFCLGFSAASGGNWTAVDIYYDNATRAASGGTWSGTWAQASDHTFKISCVGGAGTGTCTAYVDGTSLGTYTDSGFPSDVSSGHPGFTLYGNGSIAATQVASWQDY